MAKILSDEIFEHPPGQPTDPEPAPEEDSSPTQPLRPEGFPGLEWRLHLALLEAGQAIYDKTLLGMGENPPAVMTTRADAWEVLRCLRRCLGEVEYEGFLGTLAHALDLEIKERTERRSHLSAPSRRGSTYTNLPASPASSTNAWWPERILPDDLPTNLTPVAVRDVGARLVLYMNTDTGGLAIYRDGVRQESSSNEAGAAFVRLYFDTYRIDR